MAENIASQGQPQARRIASLTLAQTLHRQVTNLPLFSSLFLKSSCRRKKRLRYRRYKRCNFSDPAEGLMSMSY